MRNFSIIVLLLAIGIVSTFGQASSDSIIIKKGFGGYQFYQGDKALNMRQLTNTMKSNDQAYSEIKSAQSTYVLASICGFAGGFMIGWPIGTAMGGGDPNWTIARIGVGLVVVSIPINQRFNKQVRQAVDTFNEGAQTSSFLDRNELRLSVTGNGMKLTLHF